MVLSVPEIQVQAEKHPIIDKLGDLVNKEENPGIDAILEVTYGYEDLGKGLRYNKSLFGEYIGLKIPGEGEEIDFEGIKSLFHEKTRKDIANFEELKNQLENSDLDSLLNFGIRKQEKETLLKTIEDCITLLGLSVNGLDFELEKAGYKHGLSDIEIGSKIQVNIDLEKKVFGGNILDSKEESEYALQYLERGFDEYLKKSTEEKQKRVTEKHASRVLDSDEENRLSTYISRIREAVGDKGYKTTFDISEVKENPTRKFFRQFSHIRIPRETVKKFFKGTIDMQKMRQDVQVTSKGSIYDGPSVLEIPDSADFETLDFERVCGLLVHEISSHYVNQANHEASVYGNLRTSGNIEKEEGLAMLSEKMVKGLPVTGMDAINPSFIMVLASEIFAGEELKDFIDLYMDISERKSSPEANLARRKRNYPDDYIGVQHKDVAYVRGLLRVVNFLGVDGGNSKGNIEDLFVGKIGLDSIIDGELKFDEESMLFPILNVEIMLFYIMNALSKDESKKKHEDFIIYIREKYKGVVSDSSIEKLKSKKIERGEFKAMLGTISPIIKEFKNQMPSNDNSALVAVGHVSDRIGNVLDYESKKAA